MDDFQFQVERKHAQNKDAPISSTCVTYIEGTNAMRLVKVTDTKKDAKAHALTEELATISKKGIPLLEFHHKPREHITKDKSISRYDKEDNFPYS